MSNSIAGLKATCYNRSLSPQEYQTRRIAAAGDMAEARLDALLISGLPNVRYLSGFTGSNALLLLSPGGAALFTDPRYTVQARQQTDVKVQVVRGPLYPAAAVEIKRQQLQRIGFERSRLSWDAYESLSDVLPPGCRLRPSAGLIEKRRMLKSEAETGLIRRSVDMNSRAFDRAVKRLRPGMTEMDLAAELEYQMRRAGAEKPAFDTIVAVGPASALPHAQPGGATLQGNRLLLIDMGATGSGYASDMTRMLHLGNPGAKARGLYKAVLEAQLAAIDAVRAGVSAGSVDRKARQVLRSHGFDKQFVHSTGHGLGLEIHEPPRIGRGDATVLEAGMTITIEPGAYLEGFGGVRIEDTVLVTQTGCEVLTPTAKKLLVV